MNFLLRPRFSSKTVQQAEGQPLHIFILGQLQIRVMGLESLERLRIGQRLVLKVWLKSSYLWFWLIVIFELKNLPALKLVLLSV